MDVAQTENGSPPVAQTAPESYSLKGWLNRFKTRFQRKQPSAENTQPQNSLNDVDSVPEKQLYKSKLEQKREKEKLSSAEKIYFHTAPEDNVPSIIQSGLVGENIDGSGNVTGSIGYSLYFGSEHSNRGNLNQQDSRLENVSDNYTLTVWAKEAGLRKDQSFVKQDFKKITTPVKDKVGVDQFHASKERSALYFIPDEGLPIGKIPPEKFIAALPLDKDTREGILKVMIGAQAGIIDAYSMEKQIAELLVGKNIRLKPGLSIEELSHQLTASIELSLIRGVVTDEVREAIARPEVRRREIISQNREYLTGAPIQALWRCYLYRINVNDQVSARYYDQVIEYLSGKVAEKGVDVQKLFKYFDENIDQLKANTQPSISKEGIRLMDFSKSTNFYGGNTALAAYWLLKRDNMAQIRFLLDT